jgi:hypothetical protein
LTPTQTEHIEFATRLAIAIDAKGHKKSPTVIGNLFNLHFQGRAITPHTARNWLLGKSMPTQDKMVCLAHWRAIPEKSDENSQQHVLAPTKTHLW